MVITDMFSKLKRMVGLLLTVLLCTETGDTGQFRRVA